MATFLGNITIPDAGIETPNSPSPEWQGGLVSVTRRYWVPTSALPTFLAGLSSSDTDDEWTDAVLVSVGVSQAGDTNTVKEVEKRFQPPDWSFTIIPTGITKSAGTTLVDQPIAKSTVAITGAESEQLIAAGIETILVPMPTYTYQEVSSGSFTWSEANIISNVGKVVNAPTGMSTPTAGKWMMSSHNISDTNGATTERFTYQYDGLGWNNPVAVYNVV